MSGSMALSSISPPVWNRTHSLSGTMPDDVPRSVCSTPAPYPAASDSR
ncbi:Uncharacterised protein [Mycobacteroides abscessus]|nr:Uncharacterised protein [Mycobacteroides abscessus]